MPDIPSLSLKGFDFRPYEFKATQYTPLEYDSLPFERSLVNIETRQNEAVKEQGAVNDALAPIGAIVGGQNKEQDKWWYDYQKGIQDEIQHQLDFGDYGAARRVAIQRAHSILTDPVVRSRMSASNEYKQRVESERKRIGVAGGISQEAFNWWKENNKYEYNPVYDDNGNEIGGSHKELSDLQASLHVEDLFAEAEKLVAEEANQTTTVNDNGQSGSSYRRKTEKDIRSALNELLSKSEIQSRLHQQFEVDKYTLKQLETKYNNEISAGDEENAKNTSQQIEQYKKFLYRNGQPITDYNTWFENHITKSVYGKTLSYNRTTDVINNSTDTPSSPKHNNTFIPGSGNTDITTNNKGPGNPVKQKVDYNSQQIPNAADNIISSFKGLNRDIDKNQSFVIGDAYRGIVKRNLEK